MRDQEQARLEAVVEAYPEMTFVMDREATILDHVSDGLVPHISPQDFLVIRRPGFELKCRLNSKPVGSSIWITAHEDRNARDTALRCEGDRPVASAGRLAEKADENALIAPSILVEQNHHLATGLTPCPRHVDCDVERPALLARAGGGDHRHEPSRTPDVLR